MRARARARVRTRAVVRVRTKVKARMIGVFDVPGLELGFNTDVGSESGSRLGLESGSRLGKLLQLESQEAQGAGSRKAVVAGGRLE